MQPSSLPKRQTPSGFSSPKNLFFASLTFLIMAIAAYLFLAGYRKLAEGQIKNADREIQDIVASISLEEVEKVVTLDAQIKGLKRLLPAHIYMSSVLDFLENNTSPNISFQSLKVSAANNSITLNGVAPSLKEISIQAAAFKQNPDVRDVVLKDVSGAGESNFSFQTEILFSRNLILSK